MRLPLQTCHSRDKQSHQLEIACALTAGVIGYTVRSRYLQICALGHVRGTEQWIDCSPCHPWYGCRTDDGNPSARILNMNVGLTLRKAFITG